MVQGTVGGFKVKGCQYSAIFSFLECPFASHSNFTYDLYQAIVFALGMGVRYHAIGLSTWYPGTSYPMCLVLPGTVSYLVPVYQYGTCTRYVYTGLHGKQANSMF